MPLQRGAGILLHPTSLPSRGGIGDLGREAYAFADFLARARQGLWQILPISPPGMSDSPYSSISTFAGNPLLVSLENLAQRGWIDTGSVAKAESAKGKPATSVDFETVKAVKLPLLRRAAQQFLETRGSDRQYFERFKQETSWWLDDFVLFEVMRDVHQGRVWSSWPRELARREPEGLRRFGLEYQRELEVERAIQFAFLEQWRALHQYCGQRGIKIVGDVAIFVDYDSADVWRNREIFWLNDQLQPIVVSGVPPDAFSSTGQRWGNPLYRWDVLKSRNYDWWRQRLSWSAKNCDFLRLDHFRGFESYWEIPASEPTAIHGRWVEGPKDDFFGAIRSSLGDLPFIAEDLGMITQEVIALRERLGVPGMRVMQFGFGDPGAHYHLPHRFEANCVVYTGTHDNDTTLGWWKSLAREDERRDVRAYLGDPADGMNWGLIRAAYSSVAQWAIVPLQDVLNLGSEARMNTPSRTEHNWGWRFRSGDLTPELEKKLAAEATVSDRAA
jgi:4-alpha-glucanotransferase